MNGSAPNCSVTGSHVDVTKKCQPNLWRASPEFCQSSYTRASVTSTIESAAARTRNCVALSPLKTRRTRAPAPVAGTGALDRAAGITASDTRSLHGGDRLQLFHHHGPGKLRVMQRLGQLLSVGEHPLEEVRDGLPLRRI